MADDKGGEGSQAKAGDEAAAKASAEAASAEAAAKAKAGGAAPVEVKYDDLKVPEKSPLEASSVEAIKAFAKEHKLTLEHAQALLNRDSAAAISAKDKVEKDWADLRASWKKTVASDKVIGGEKLPENLEMIKRYIQKYDKDGSFAKELETSGLGDHPAFLKFIHSAAVLGKEDHLEDGAPADQKGTQKPLEARLSGREAG